MILFTFPLISYQVTSVCVRHLTQTRRGRSTVSFPLKKQGQGINSALRAPYKIWHFFRHLQIWLTCAKEDKEAGDGNSSPATAHLLAYKTGLDIHGHVRLASPASADPSPPSQSTERSHTSPAPPRSQSRLTGLREEMGPDGAAGMWSQGLCRFNRQWHSNLVLFSIHQNEDAEPQGRKPPPSSQPQLAPGQLRLVHLCDCIVFWLPSFSGWELLPLLHFPQYSFRQQLYPLSFLRLNKFCSLPGRWALWSTQTPAGPLCISAGSPQSQLMRTGNRVKARPLHSLSHHIHIYWPLLERFSWMHAESGGSFLTATLHCWLVVLHERLHIVLLVYLQSNYILSNAKCLNLKRFQLEAAEKSPQNNRGMKSLPILLQNGRGVHKANLPCCILSPKSITKRITIKKYHYLMKWFFSDWQAIIW